MAKSFLKGKVILVTGGTGSFGQHFVRRLLKDHEPEKVVVFSRDELKQSVMADKIKDDMKIIAQALKENIEFVLTDDARTFYKYCERLRTANNWNIKAIKLADGFSSGSLRLDGQSDIESFT